MRKRLAHVPLPTEKRKPSLVSGVLREKVPAVDISPVLLGFFSRYSSFPPALKSNSYSAFESQYVISIENIVMIYDKSELHFKLQEKNASHIDKIALRFITFSIILAKVLIANTRCCRKLLLESKNNSSNVYPALSASSPWWCKPRYSGMASLPVKILPSKSNLACSLV